MQMLRRSLYAQPFRSPSYHSGTSSAPRYHTVPARGFAKHKVDVPETRQQPPERFLKSLFLHVIVLRNGHSGENAEDDQDGMISMSVKPCCPLLLSHRIPPSTNVKNVLNLNGKSHVWVVIESFSSIEYLVIQVKPSISAYSAIRKYPSCFFMKVLRKNGAALNKTAYKKIIPL